MRKSKITTRAVVILGGLLLTMAGIVQADDLGTDIALLNTMDSATSGSRTLYYEDVSGNGYHVRNIALPSYDGGGARSTAVDFTYSSTWNVNVMKVLNGDSTDLLPGTGDYSISMWYWEPTFVLDDDTSDDFSYLVSYGNYTGSADPGFSLDTYQGRPHIRTQDINAESGTRCQPLASSDESGKWNHIVMVCDRTGVSGTSNQLQLYVNGILSNFGSLNPTSTGDPNNILAEVGEELLIGGKKTRYGQFNGYLDDIAFYQGVLTYSDVTTLYNATGLDASTVTNPNVTPVMIHNFENRLDGTTATYGTLVDDAYDTYTGEVHEVLSTITDAERGDVLNFDQPGREAGVHYGDVLDPMDNDYTVSIWFKTDDSYQTQFVVGKGAASSSLDGWGIYLDNGKLYMRANHGDDTNKLGIRHAFTANEWHHVAMVIDNENGVFKGYFDGESSGTDGTDGDWVLSGGTTSFTPGVVFDCDQELLLGKRSNESAYSEGVPFLGQLDDFAIWERALTDTEILSIYNGTTITVPDPNIPGDANNDGKVDGSDVTILANNWQAGVPSGDPNVTWAMGDFNGDHMVDGSDVTILANNWQYGVNTAAASVPEPSTLVLLLAAAIGLLMVHRRK